MQTTKQDKGSKRTTDFEPEVESWMKTHSVGDLNDLASELENKGVDVADMKEAIEACIEIENGRLPRMGDS